jgi:hypothetical protein
MSGKHGQSLAEYSKVHGKAMTIRVSQHSRVHVYFKKMKWLSVGVIFTYNILLQGNAMTIRARLLYVKDFISM